MGNVQVDLFFFLRSFFFFSNFFCLIGISKGAIIGIIIGVVFLSLVIIIIISYFLWKRKASLKKKIDRVDIEMKKIKSTENK
jgi:mannitol-specific phosphotransferase system IIBC component